MSEEYKDLLLKDLCARLPYGLKCLYYDKNGNKKISELLTIWYKENRVFIGHYSMDYDGSDVIGVLPYLFPLSSMTEGQRNELKILLRPSVLKSLDEDEDDEDIEFPTLISANPSVVEIDYYNKNHFDYRGLIEKDLAIDATGQKIYKEETK